VRTLVISPNWIGDAVMAQPLLQLLKAAHPERPIDVLAPPAVSPVWRQMAEVAEVLETPFRHGALQLKERWRYARMLRQRGYADAYILPNTLKFALIPWLAGIPRRVGYKGESRYGLINVMHHDDTPPRPMVPFYAALADAPGAPLRGGCPSRAWPPAANRSLQPAPRLAWTRCAHWWSLRRAPSSGAPSAGRRRISASWRSISWHATRKPRWPCLVRPRMARHAMK